MNELEKMLAGEEHDVSAPEIQKSFHTRRLHQERFNRTQIDQGEEYYQALTALIPGTPRSTTVVPPFYCDHGHPIRLGEGVFINVNCTFLDGGGIRIGDRTLIGPNCQLYTPLHPMDYLERRKPVERALGIEIGADCWLGGGVIVCPGVRIGDRTIIAAGSVVTRDLPDDVLAAGNPATVKRKLRP